ncbi:MAG: hypothetical protein ACJ735_03615 [Actinomycetes bacterium]
MDTDVIAAVAITVVRRDSAPLEADVTLYGALRTLLAGERTRLVVGIAVGLFGWQWIGYEKGISPLGVSQVITSTTKRPA